MKKIFPFVTAYSDMSCFYIAVVLLLGVSLKLLYLCVLYFYFFFISSYLFPRLSPRCAEKTSHGGKAEPVVGTVLFVAV
jgi:hypothetical protein